MSTLSWYQRPTPASLIFFHQCISFFLSTFICFFSIPNFLRNSNQYHKFKTNSSATNQTSKKCQITRFKLQRLQWETKQIRCEIYSEQEHSTLKIFSYFFNFCPLIKKIRHAQTFDQNSKLDMFNFFHLTKFLQFTEFRSNCKNFVKWK